MAVGSCWQVLVLYQFYGGVAGVLQFTSVGDWFATLFSDIATLLTFALLTAIGASLVATFVPSSGGQWIVRGFVMLTAAAGPGASAQQDLLALGAGDQVGKLLESLTGPARRAWLAQNPLPGHVQYYSLAAFTTRERMAVALVPVWKHLLSHDQRNDGQLLARDALIPGSTLLGYPDADHWSVALDVEILHPVLGERPDPDPFPRTALLESILLQLAESRASRPARP